MMTMSQTKDIMYKLWRSIDSSQCQGSNLVLSINVVITEVAEASEVPSSEDPSCQDVVMPELNPQADRRAQANQAAKCRKNASNAKSICKAAIKDRNEMCSCRNCLL